MIETLIKLWKSRLKINFITSLSKMKNVFSFILFYLFIFIFILFILSKILNVVIKKYHWKFSHQMTQIIPRRLHIQVLIPYMLIILTFESTYKPMHLQCISVSTLYIIWCFICTDTDEYFLKTSLGSQLHKSLYLFLYTSLKCCYV